MSFDRALDVLREKLKTFVPPTKGRFPKGVSPTGKNPAYTEIQPILHAPFSLRYGFTKDELFAGGFDFFDENLDGIAEVPLELWDIVDDKSNPMFQLWLIGGDGGVLVEAGTTKRVGKKGSVQGIGTEIVNFAISSLQQSVSLLQMVNIQKAVFIGWALQVSLDYYEEKV